MQQNFEVGMKIIAVIVTFNRMQLLTKVIDAVLGQSEAPDEILVVNNNSTDGTIEYLDAVERDLSHFTHIHLKQNVGGAGGFYQGIKEAYEKNADWVWIMDDDAIPMPDALSKMVNSNVFHYYLKRPKLLLGFLASRVDWTDGEICNMNIPNVTRNWHYLHHLFHDCIKIRSASFVSILINRKAIKKVGYPVKEFFIWFDDAEYTRRITNHMPAYYIPDSVVVHWTDTNMRPMDFSQLNADTLWKFKYGMRNEVAATCNADLGLVRGMMFVARKCYYMIRAEKLLPYFFPLMSAALSGLFFKYKKMIEYPSE